MLRSPLLGALLFVVALTVLMTWPQGVNLGTQVLPHPDPFLSMWRLKWVAHALTRDAGHLFDGNIFYPHLRTLAYSDATLVEAFLAAPWLWAGTNPVLVYNILLLAGIVSSGVGMFVLVRHLTGNVDAALVSAAIFTLVPYRIEHLMHLELQWTAWIPLTLWAVHRIFERASLRLGVFTGALLCLQVLSCMYYGAFLGIMVGALVVLLAVAEPRRASKTVAALCIAAILPIALTVAYAQPYLENARTLGTRDLGDINRFSAHLASYITAPPQNWLWGWTADRFDGNELRLYPGIVAVLVSVFALANRRRRPLVWIYVAMTAIATTLSLGLNGPVYRWLYAHAWVLGAFRAPARFSILACCGLAVLAGLGFEYLERAASAARLRKVVLVAVLTAVGIDYGSSPIYLTDVPAVVPDVYKFIKTLEPSVLIELPDFLSPQYMYWSTTHWHSLVNGYSGVEPPDYTETMKQMRTFPDDEAIARLRQLDVRYILVHESFYSTDDYTALMLRILRRPELAPNGKYRDWVGWTHMFELRPPAAIPDSAGHGARQISERKRPPDRPEASKIGI